MDILVLGPLSGPDGVGGATRREPLATRAPLPIDVDNFDERFGRFAPRARLDLGGGGDAVTIALGAFDDFHPDALFERLPLFESFRDARRRLGDPSTFAAAAETVGPAAGVTEAERGEAESEAQTLRRLLGAEDPGGDVTPADDVRTGVESFIRSVVAPYVVPGKHPRQEEWLASFDHAIGDAMRRVLHDPRLQALESRWRSLRWLVNEAGDASRVWALDATREEIADDLRGGRDVEASALGRALLAGVPGASSWWAIVADFRFGAEAADLESLAALGAIAARARAPLLAEADPGLIGCRSLAETPSPRDWRPLDPDRERAWRALRQDPAARWIGLLLPRVLVRLPYGAATDPIERFAFEELPEDRPHQAYLWGNPAFAAAGLIARSFAEEGPSFEPGSRLEIEDLPAHSYKEGGEARLQPCAEVLLAENAVRAILERGLMPLVSRSDKNSVRLARFQSIAEPAAPLAGRWAS